MKPPEYEPRFVSPTEGSPTQLLQKAYDALNRRDFEPKWFTPSQILSIAAVEKHCIYIVDPFVGESFAHLEKLGCRVYGPSCILSCFEAEKPLPRQAAPLFCTSMRGLIVCFSNIETKERERLMRMVNYMGGEVMKVLTEHVTHLVTNQVGSKKYIVATSNLKIPIMLPEWVDAVWGASSVGKIHGANDDFKKFACKIFHGVSVTVSGLDSQERKRIQAALEHNGGMYSGEMRRDRTTHLVTTEPKGQKYSFAAKWKIHIVHPQWLHDSLHAGYCQDESLYLLDSYKTSTPTKNDKRLPSMSDMSSIMSQSMMNVTSVNETMSRTSLPNSTITTYSNQTTNCSETNNNNNNKVGEKEADLLMELEMQSSDLLDGCKVYLSGFCGERLDKMRKFVNMAGGTRLSSVNDNVTHVIVNGRILDPSLTDDVKACSCPPHVVSLAWLVRSQKDGKLLPEDDFTCLQPLETTSPVIKKLPSKRKSSDKNESVTDETTLTEDHDMKDLLSQYITTNDDDDQSTKMSQTLEEDATRLETDNDVTKLEDDDVTRLDNDASLDGESVLGKRTVVVIGFDLEAEQELTSIVVELGGRVVNAKDRVVPYYAIVPPYGCSVSVSVNEVVTSLWLQRCQEEETLLNVNDNVLYRPLSVKDAKPLVNCVIAITGFAGLERELLLELCGNMGAVVQEVFCKKANKKTQASTHLLAAVPEGLKTSKYEAAKKVNVPVVTKEWVVKCATTGERHPEKEFEAVEVENAAVDDGEDDAEVTVKVNIAPVDDVVVQITSEPLKPTYSSSRNGDGTPVMKSGRVQELKNKEKSTTHTSPDVSKMTPNTALANIKFDVPDLLSAFDTPVSQKRNRRKSSLSLEDLYSHHIGLALRRFEHPDEATPDPTQGCEGSQNSEDEHPLKNVIIAVSKKLSDKQSEYFNIASRLGGDYRWVYDNSCTHYIHQGRSDSSKDYKMAKEKGKYIVSPYWLLMCEQQNSRVDEGLFPANFNPSMSLSVTTPRPTPVTRRQARRAQVGAETCASPSLTARPEKAVPSKPEKAVPSEPEKIDTGAIETQALYAEQTTKKQDPRVVEAAVEEMKTPAKVEEGSSLEMQQVIQKELEDIMANSKTMSSNSNSAPRVTKSRRPANADNLASRSKRLTRTNSSTVKDDDDMCSQQGDVTWDDPNSRKEREKFVHVLHKPYSPTQHSETQFSEPAKFDFQSKDAFLAPVSSPRPGKEEDKPPPTPEAPSLIFPRPKLAVSAPSPQPVDPPSVSMECVEPKILLSGMTQQEKDNYGALIESLGGTLLECGTFDANCTHLVAGQPTRNEKCLASIASGKWILHKSWLEASREAGVFVKEDEHEWGAAGTLAVKNPQTVTKLSEAAHRWRVKLQRKKLGAFHDWKVIICAPKNRTGGFKRLLVAGGATVLCTRPPFTNVLSTATHAFMDLAKCEVDVNLEDFARAGVPCYKPEFIAGFLTDEFMDKASYVIAELAKDSAGKKRKSSGTSAEMAKKSKLT